MRNNYMILFELLFLGILLSCLIVSAILSEELYLYLSISLLLIIIALSEWRFTGLALMLFFTGEISMIACGYALFWLIVPTQVAATGLFLLKMNLLSNWKDFWPLIIIAGLILIFALLIDSINHMPIPVVITVISMFCFVLFALISEFRLRRQYAGDTR